MSTYKPWFQGGHYTRKKVARVYENLRMRAKGTFRVEELDEITKEGWTVFEQTSGEAREDAFKEHLGLVKETKNRAEWLKETGNSTGGHAGAKGFGLGISHEKTREPIDSNEVRLL